MKHIGIDLGGHTISAALVSFDGEPRLLSSATIKTPAGRDLVSVVGKLEDLALMWAAPGDDISVGIAVPGFVDKEREKIVKLTNFTGCDGAALASMMAANLRARRISVRAAMENDANCAALGEGIAGCARGLSDYIVLTLGTGIGGGVITDGRLLRGAHGMGGECGHIAVGSEGSPCRCGGTSHLEGCASADWIERRAAEAGLPGDFRELWQLREEASVMAILSPALDAIARGIASLYAIFDPQAVILSGGMSRAEGLDAEVAVRLPKYLSAPFAPYAEIKISESGGEAALIGAASL